MDGYRIPIIMMPLADARNHGLVQEEHIDGDELRLSQTLLAFNGLQYILKPQKLYVEENDKFYLDSARNGRITINNSPLKKFRGKIFDPVNFRYLLMRYRRLPIVHEEKVYLYAWKHCENLFGLAKVVDYLWKHHRINYYYDGGLKHGIETRDSSEKIEELSKDSDEAFRQFMQETLDSQSKSDADVRR